MLINSHVTAYNDSEVKLIFDTCCHKRTNFEFFLQNLLYVLKTNLPCKSYLEMANSCAFFISACAPARSPKDCLACARNW